MWYLNKYIIKEKETLMCYPQEYTIKLIHTSFNNKEEGFPHYHISRKKNNNNTMRLKSRVSRKGK